MEQTPVRGIVYPASDGALSRALWKNRWRKRLEFGPLLSGGAWLTGVDLQGEKVGKRSNWQERN